MTTTSRQNNLILAEDWKRIYQTFKNADFKSYDFENLRRVIITYLQENYPEDFNDYIESSEYLALIDAIAFLGQSLSFRIDLASRENFIDIADRKESVLRLARMLSYNAKRCKAASGLLKFDTVSTTESVVDSNGRNLSQQVIVWNDPTNNNWYEQFILVLNAAMAPNTQFGNSEGEAVIDGIITQQYRFNTNTTDVPIYSYSRAVSSRSTAFEIVSTVFPDGEKITEESPMPGNQLGFIFRSDGKGAASAGTGFYLMFKQGSLELADFVIQQPTTNERVSVDSSNINDDDVWLYRLDSNGLQSDEWTKVPALSGNNIIYNSISKDVRDIFTVITTANDKVELQFSDGIYGNLPQGAFRVYYRVSNGLTYSISPNEMRGISVSVPYINAAGTPHTLTFTLSLKYTVNNAAASETVASIRSKAPALYYTQNRMITGEDYNLAPLSASQDVLKVKAVNRTSSGISRNFDIIDATGKYSKVNVFADDGILYKHETEKALSLKFKNKSEIVNFIRHTVETEINGPGLYNFYLGKFDKILFSDRNIHWLQITVDGDSSTGYFRNVNDQTKLKVGNYTSTNLKYIEAGSLVKFTAPTGKAFKNNKLVPLDTSDFEQKDRLWVRVVSVIGDGTNANRGVLANGKGPITFSEVVPTDAVITQIVPKFITNIGDALETEVINLINNYSNFGLRYSVADRDWKIITASNLNTSAQFFSSGLAGDTSGLNLDSSWLLAFVYDGIKYDVHIRELDFIFESLQQNRFYFDSRQKVYDIKTKQTVKDQVNVLGINTDFNRITPIKNDIRFEIVDNVRFEDGYQSTSGVKLAFFDSDDDGIIDNPDSFEIIAGADDNLKFLFFKKSTDEYGATVYQYIDNSSGAIKLASRTNLVNINNYNNGDLVYFYDQTEDVVKRVNKSTNTFEIESSYRANIGRDKVRFQYIHNAGVDRRIDPSVSNIIDVYILTRSYDTDYRNYLAGYASKPIAANSDQLRIQFGSGLNAIKSVSDEIIYHPVQFKPLFGAKADVQFQAQFKVVKNPSRTISDNDIKVRIIAAMNEFFAVDGWDFGDKFYFTEMATYVINQLSPDISNFVLVPRQTTQKFGSLFEIQSRQDEIFVSAATVDDIVIVDSITASEINLDSNSIISNTSQ